MRQRRLLITVVAVLLSIVAFFGSSALLPPQVASAHAFVVGSDPIDGSTISRAPGVVRIFFNANISPISSAHVFSVQNGQLVDVTASRSSIPAPNPRELDTPLKQPATLPQGSYEVQWTAVANDDGHTTYGLIGFNVGVSSTGLSGVPVLGPSTSNKIDEMHTLTSTRIIAIAWDWLTLLALTFWIGILVSERLILAHLDRTLILLDQARRQVRSLQWLCLFMLLFGEIVALLLRSIRLAQASDGDFNLSVVGQMIIDTRYGLLWLVRIALYIIALGLLYWTNRTTDKHATAARPVRSGPLAQANTADTPSNPGAPKPARTPSAPLITAGQNNGNGRNVTKDAETGSTTAALYPPQPYTVLWLLLAGLIVLTYALTGDAAQLFQPRISAIVFDWLHMVAQGIWFGGLAYFGYVLLPMLSVVDRDHRAETIVTLQRRYKPFYLGSIAALLVTTLFLSEAAIGNPQHWLDDPYGRTLLVQLCLLAVLLLLSLYLLLIQGPKLTRQVLLLSVVDAELPARRVRQSALEQDGRTLKQITILQSLLAAGVLFCSALLTFYAPPIVFPAITYGPPTTSQTPAPDAGSSQSKQVGNLSVTLQMQPAKVDQANTITLTIKDSNGNPVTNAQVRATINMQIMDMGTTQMKLHNDGTAYTATFDKGATFSMTGAWNVDVSIQTPNQAPLTARFQVMVS